ncbi:hypothetical protein LOTGIDRAFT_160854 [Lottia gigantea]|uniref:Uncharacterized protein n=1 Tax=Lottia gigantea TaxID=225164 RepID=V4ANA3_LOTGI|nr:hypothetical protein LOTGIDRAFT_160854 [Lottia gigantea]ESO95091.1 hypothetical protein LOTGIDRAFT_160854 [Lottia gigantea]
MAVSAPSTITTDPICSTPSYISTTAVFREEQCYCDCFEIDTDPAVIQEIIDHLVTNLTVNTGSLSSTRREKTSAPDDRPTAISVGFFGIMIILIVIAAIIFQDVAAVSFLITKAVIRKIRTGTFKEPKKPKRKNKRIDMNNLDQMGPTVIISEGINNGLPDVEDPVVPETNSSCVTVSSVALTVTIEPTTHSKPRRRPKNTSSSVPKRPIISTMKKTTTTRKIVSKTKPLNVKASTGSKSTGKFNKTKKIGVKQITKLKSKI